MSAAPLPDDQSFPDAISTEALLAALGREMPEASALPALVFGASDKHEGANDLVLLLTLILSLDDAPGNVQLVNALAFLADRLNVVLQESSELQRLAFAREIQEHASSNPPRAQAAQAALEMQQEDMADLLVHASIAATSLNHLRTDALEAQVTVEILRALGDQTPNPDRRRRFFSDEFLTSIGMDIEAFESYFDSRSRD
jgi:hypothetical protein